MKGSSPVARTMIYRFHKVEGYSGPKFWQWFDRMPREVRDAVNKSMGSQRTLWLWAKAVKEHGERIQREIANGK